MMTHISYLQHTVVHKVNLKKIKMMYADVKMIVNAISQLLFH